MRLDAIPNVPRPTTNSRTFHRPARLRPALAIKRNHVPVLPLVQKHPYGHLSVVRTGMPGRVPGTEWGDQRLDTTAAEVSGRDVG